MTEENIHPSSKIIVIGLAQAGKTSIIKSLLRQFSLLSAVKPTLGVQREEIEFLGRDLYFWDFGGQQTYQDQYFTEPKMYFGDISYMFYVVDIQDPVHVDISVNYFKKVYENIQVLPKEFSIKYKGNELDFYLVIGFIESKSIFHKDRLEGIIEDLSRNFQTLFQNIDLDTTFTQ